MQRKIKEFYLHLPNADIYSAAEYYFQVAIMRYIKCFYPYAFVFHPHNEGTHKVAYRKKQTAMGMMAGIPDVMILNPIGSYSGMALELKKGNNKPTARQLDCMERLEKIGYAVGWTNQFTAATIFITKYMYGRYDKEQALGR